MQGIRVPVRILKHNLSKSALAVLISLYDIAESVGQRTIMGYEVKVKLTTLSARCNVDVRTASRCIAQLTAKGLISSRTRTVREDRKRGTYVYALPAVGTYFMLSRHAFQRVINAAPKALRTYLFCVNAAGNNNYFYHSFSDIAKATGEKRSDVIRHIEMLENIKLIRRRRKHFRRQPKRFTENSYMVFTFAKTIKRQRKNPQRAARKSGTLRTRNSNYIVKHLQRFVKRFLKIFKVKFRRRCFWNKGRVQNVRSYIKPTVNLIYRRNKFLQD